MNPIYAAPSSAAIRATPGRGHDEEADALRAETETDALGRASDQADLGLDVITDGEGYRENMYYFYQKRLDGVTFENMPSRAFGDCRASASNARGSSAKSRIRVSSSRKLEARPRRRAGRRVA